MVGLTALQSQRLADLSESLRETRGSSRLPEAMGLAGDSRVCPQGPHVEASQGRLIAHTPSDQAISLIWVKKTGGQVRGEGRLSPCPQTLSGSRAQSHAGLADAPSPVDGSQDPKVKCPRQKWRWGQAH